MCLDLNIGNGTCVIRHIPCACTQYTSMLDKPWTPGVPPHQQLCYQLFKYFTYWPVLVSCNNWNFIQFSHKATTGDDIENIHQVVIYVMSENMNELVQTY